MARKQTPRKHNKLSVSFFFFSHPPLLLLLRLFLVSFRIRERWVAEPGKGSSPTTLSPLQVLRGVGGGREAGPRPGGVLQRKPEKRPIHTLAASGTGLIEDHCWFQQEPGAGGGGVCV